MIAGMSAGDYVHNGSFDVIIDNITLSFSRISGLNEKIEYEFYNEGGGEMHILPKNKSGGTITFEKGIAVADITMNFFRAGVSAGDIFIQLRKNNIPASLFLISGGMVVSCEIEDFDAISSKVAIRKFTVAYTDIIMV